jgi:hypothetical protein
LTVPVGYRLDRIEALDWQTRHTIADLRRLRASDPAAASAMQSIFSTVRALEDHWMPLIAAIRATDIMVTWTRSALDTSEWRTCSVRSDRFVLMSDDELIVELFAFEQRWAATTGWYDEADVGYGELVTYAPLMHAVEARVADNADFRATLLATAGDTDALLLFLARGVFPTGLVAKVARAVVGRPDIVGPAGLRRAVLTDALLRRVADDPDASLDMLLDVDVARQILAFDNGLDIWVNRPATPGVAALVHAGLTEPHRRSDGFTAFSWFIEQANNAPIDRSGFAPGVASGLAVAMQHYVPMFIHSIDGSDSEELLTKSGIHADRNGDGVDDALASYEAMTDLFGALLHNAEAVSLLGILLAATADDVAAERATLSEASHLAGLLRDAGHNEDLEAALVAAARTARQGQIIGVLASATKVATGVGGAARAVFDVSTKYVADLLNATDGSGERADATFDPGSVTRHLVQMALIRRLAKDSSHRRNRGITSPADAWSDVSRRLDELDRLTVSGAHSTELQTARQRIFNRVRQLGGGSVIDSLDEHGTLAGLPNRDVRGD